MTYSESESQAYGWEYYEDDGYDYESGDGADANIFELWRNLEKHRYAEKLKEEEDERIRAYQRANAPAYHAGRASARDEDWQDMEGKGSTDTTRPSDYNESLTELTELNEKEESESHHSHLHSESQSQSQQVISVGRRKKKRLLYHAVESMSTTRVKNSNQLGPAGRWAPRLVMELDRASSLTGGHMRVSIFRHLNCKRSEACWIETHWQFNFDRGYIVILTDGKVSLRLFNRIELIQAIGTDEESTATGEAYVSNLVRKKYDIGNDMDRDKMAVFLMADQQYARDTQAKLKKGGGINTKKLQKLVRGAKFHRSVNVIAKFETREARDLSMYAVAMYDRHMYHMQGEEPRGTERKKAKQQDMDIRGKDMMTYDYWPNPRLERRYTLRGTP